MIEGFGLSWHPNDGKFCLLSIPSELPMSTSPQNHPLLIITSVFVSPAKSGTISVRAYLEGDAGPLGRLGDHVGREVADRVVEVGVLVRHVEQGRHRKVLGGRV